MQGKIFWSCLPADEISSYDGLEQFAKQHNIDMILVSNTNTHFKFKEKVASGTLVDVLSLAKEGYNIYFITDKRAPIKATRVFFIR